MLRPCCTVQFSQQLVSQYSSERSALAKTAVKLRGKLLGGDTLCNGINCQLLQSVAKSRAEFYFVQRFAQQKNCKITHVILCNSPATCLATTLRDKLLKNLHSVTGPLNWFMVRFGDSLRSFARQFHVLIVLLRKDL